MMVRKAVFEDAGGFDENNLAVAFNDIDFCLRLRQKNFLIVYTPYAELYHHESISRGFEQMPKNAARFRREFDYMRERWQEVLQSDPYYNPNLTLEKEDFSIAVVSRLTEGDRRDN
jgi:GT2 family glycosyltransferase